MTNEQKLLILLQKAVENGWEDTLDFYTKNTDHIFKEDITVWNSKLQNRVLYSINDLVLNFEPNKTDFVEALFTALINEVEDFNEVRESYMGQFKLNYILLPTSRRLDYLFQTFKALIK